MFLFSPTVFNPYITGEVSRNEQQHGYDVLHFKMLNCIHVLIPVQ